MQGADRLTIAADISPDSRQLAAQSKRKEKARIAARARRSQEANIIMEMAIELHITQEKIRRIDKATIVKLAIDYIKAFEILCRFHRSSYRQKNHPQECLKLTQMPAINNTNNNLDSNNQIRSNNFPTPTLNTRSIFAPKTEDMDSHFLIIDQDREGRSSIVLKPDTEVLDEDDLTHLAPQAGDVSISLEVESLDNFVSDSSLLFGETGSSSPPLKKAAPISLIGLKESIDNSYSYIKSIGAA